MRFILERVKAYIKLSIIRDLNFIVKAQTEVIWAWFLSFYFPPICKISIGDISRIFVGSIDIFQSNAFPANKRRKQAVKKLMQQCNGQCRQNVWGWKNACAAINVREKRAEYVSVTQSKGIAAMEWSAACETETTRLKSEVAVRTRKE